MQPQLLLALLLPYIVTWLRELCNEEQMSCIRKCICYPKTVEFVLMEFYYLFFPLTITSFLSLSFLFHYSWHSDWKTSNYSHHIIWFSLEYYVNTSFSVPLFANICEDFHQKSPSSPICSSIFTDKIIIQNSIFPHERIWWNPIFFSFRVLTCIPLLLSLTHSY